MGALRTGAAVSLAVLLGLRLTLAGQATGSTVGGEVLDGVSGLGIARARVNLLGITHPGTFATQSDDNGRFVFRSISAGRYELFVTAPGYSAGGVGRIVRDGSAAYIDVTDGAPSLQNRLHVWKLGVIAGAVVDEHGEPAVNVRVVALSREAAAGRIAWNNAQHATTDDKGRFRLSGLAPGRFVVAIPSGSSMGSATVNGPSMFFPSTSSAVAATPIIVNPGEDHSGIDFALRAPVGLRKIAGRLVRNEGAVSSCTVRLIPWEARDSPSELETQTTKTSTDGLFRFVDVPPGMYRLAAVAVPQTGQGRGEGTVRGGAIRFPSGSGSVQPTPPAATLWGETSVVVGDQDLTDVTLPLQVGARIFGKLIYEGSSPAPSTSNGMFVIVTPADGRDDLGSASIPLAPVGGDLQFETVGLPPGLYEVSPWTRTLYPWSVSSIVVGGKEISGGPIEVRTSEVRSVEIVLTDHPASLSGMIRDRKGSALPNAVVLAFATNPLLRHHIQWSASRVAMVQSDAQGRYQATGLLPGDYYVTIVPTDRFPLWSLPDQDQLDRLVGSSVTIRLEKHESRLLDLSSSAATRR